MNAILPLAKVTIAGIQFYAAVTVKAGTEIDYITLRVPPRSDADIKLNYIRGTDMMMHISTRVALIVRAETGGLTTSEAWWQTPGLPGEYGLAVVRKDVTYHRVQPVTAAPALSRECPCGIARVDCDYHRP